MTELMAAQQAMISLGERKDSISFEDTDCNLGDTISIDRSQKTFDTRDEVQTNRTTRDQMYKDCLSPAKVAAKRAIIGNYISSNVVVKHQRNN